MSGSGRTLNAVFLAFAVIPVAIASVTGQLATYPNLIWPLRSGGFCGWTDGHYDAASD